MNFNYFVLTVLSIFMLGGMIHIIKGPTVWDRLLGFNIISSKIITSIIVLALFVNKTYILDIAILYALLGFVGIIMIARFVEHKGDV